MAQGRVFISYSRQDSDFVLKLARDLRISNIDIWIDQLDLVGGPDWRKQVQQQLESSRRMIVVLTPTSVDSRYVRSEWTYALDHEPDESDLLPIVLRDCKVPFGLHDFQHIFFTDETPYERAFGELLLALGVDEAARDESVRAMLERSANPTSLEELMPATGRNREVLRRRSRRLYAAAILAFILLTPAVLIPIGVTRQLDSIKPQSCFTDAVTLSSRNSLVPWRWLKLEVYGYKAANDPDLDTIRKNGISLVADETRRESRGSVSLTPHYPGGGTILLPRGKTWISLIAPSQPPLLWRAQTLDLMSCEVKSA